MGIIELNRVKPRIERYIAENKGCGDLYLSGCGDGAYHVLGMLEEATEISWIKVSKKKFYEIINQIQEKETILWMPYLYYLDRADWRHKKDVGRIEEKTFRHRYWINSDYLK